MVNQCGRRRHTVIKIGFICEGKTEKKIIESEKFQKYLLELGIEMIAEVRNAEGNGNLLPKHLPQFVLPLIELGAEHILILTDLDQDACITTTKDRIDVDRTKIVIVAIKQIESWFLADSDTLSLLLRDNFEFDDPEAQDNPYNTLKNLFKSKRSRGIGTKDKLARHMIKYGFSVENAANHPNCSSANYFLNKLVKLSLIT